MKDLKHIKRFNESEENLNSELSKGTSSSISDVSDSSKSIAVDFAKWIADNKWYKQVRYDVWDKSGETTKSTSQLFDLFIEKLHISDVICSDCLNDKPFYMSSRSGNKPDYNSFGYNEYKQYDI